MFYLSDWGCWQGAPLVQWWKYPIPIMPRTRSPSLIHPTPTKVLLPTTYEPLVRQLSGSRARGVGLLEQLLHDEPTPQKMLTFAHELSVRLREVGRCILTWTCNRLEPANDDAAPSQVQFAGRLSRRRRPQPRSVATLFGPVPRWRRLYEPLQRGRGSIHPLARREGVAAG
jgi:hypothetical protein